MATFVIVHGAWSGAHAWRWVRPILRDAGHEVFTPSLTGLGERRHLAGPAVDLEMHVADVINCLEFEDLHDVVLVGHSYGGMVVASVTDRVPQRIGHAVYLDAEAPDDGECELDFVPPEERATYEESAKTRGDGWRVPPPVPDPLPPGLPPEVEWTLARMVPQPLRTFTQPARLTGAGARVRRTYVLHTAEKGPEDVATRVQRIREDESWQFEELAAGHAAHVTAPELMADLLLRLA